MLLLFYTPLLFFLALHVPFYHFFINSNCADKISRSREVISPLGFLLYLRVALEQFYSKFAFQYPHHLRDRNLRRNRHDKVNVVILYTYFLNLAPFPLTQYFYIFFYQLLDFSSQDPKRIFRYPDNVVLTFINNMREFFVITHVINIVMAYRTLPPPKEVGF
jgi:hypothetical protein